MSIITGTVTNGITLGQAGFTSPLIVTHTGTVSNGTGAAVYTSGTYRDPIVLNQGVISDTGAFAAVALNDGGIVANSGNGAVIQGYTGIYVSGAVGVVTNSGTIAGTGTFGGGIILSAGGSVQNSGFIQGGAPIPFYRYGYTYHIGGAVTIGTGPGAVSNSGTITGTGVGLGGSALYLAGGGKVDNRGLIQGSIDISNPILYSYYLSSGGPAGTVTNSGTITSLFGAIASAGSGSNVVENSGLIESYLGAAVSFLNHNGTATVINSGTITGGHRGIALSGGSSVRNRGFIQGGYGIDGGIGAVINSGTIIGTGAEDGGVVIDGSLNNTGLILAQDAGGVYLSYGGNDVGSVTNSGTIEGTGSLSVNNPLHHNGGVFLGAGGSVANSGLIQGLSGVYVGKAAGTLTNSGTITGTSLGGVVLAVGGAVVNRGKGALIQGYTGIDVSGTAGAVTNSGTIVGTGTYGGGVVLEAGGRVQNSGLIEGGPPIAGYIQGYYQTYKFPFGGAVSIGGSAGTVSNSGTIVGTNGGSGIFLAFGGSAENTGFVEGGIQSGENFFGLVVYGGGPGTVTNSGSITGGVNLAFGGSVLNSGYIAGRAGVYSGEATTVVNFGTILATTTYRAGVDLSGGSIRNTGLIQGGFGVRAGGSATLTNSGTIIGTGDSRGGVEIEGDGLGRVSNTGLILGQNAGGVYISYYSSGVGAVTNTGTIKGTGGPGTINQLRHYGGVFLGAGGSVANGGLIQGVSGVYVDKAAGSVANSGTITGTSLAGVALAAGGTVVDSGTITGGDGTAVSFGGSGGNLLGLEHGYNLGGAVTVTGAANTLELLGAAGAVTVDFDKAGAGFTNFGTVAFALSGNHDQTLAITDDTTLPGIISGFTQRHDIVDLTQFASKHATATLNAGDQLVVANGSQSVSLQLDPSENYSGVVWQARPDGSGGTDVTVQNPGAPPPAPASSARLAATDATFGSAPAPHYKNGASLSQLIDGSTSLEHFLLASGHGPPFG
jgi:hypothetical protein